MLAIPDLIQEKFFHNEGDQTLEQEPREAVDNLSVKTSKAWLSKAIILLWASVLGETASSDLPHPLCPDSIQTVIHLWNPRSSADWCLVAVTSFDLPEKFRQWTEVVEHLTDGWAQVEGTDWASEVK